MGVDYEATAFYGFAIDKLPPALEEMEQEDIEEWLYEHDFEKSIGYEEGGNQMSGPILYCFFAKGSNISVGKYSSGPDFAALDESSVTPELVDDLAILRSALGFPDQHIGWHLRQDIS